MLTAFDLDLVFVGVGLVVVGIGLWLSSADLETAGLMYAGLAAYAAWLDGEDL
jgi:hypothetical protein